MRAEAIRALVEKHHIFFEILPYYVLLDKRPAGEPIVHKRIQAGFDVNLYAAGAEKPLRLAVGDQEFCAAVEDLQRACAEILSQPAAEIETTPFDHTVVFDTHRNLRPEALLRIRIAHNRGLEQPEGSVEERKLSEIRRRLRELGVHEGPSE